MENVNLPQSHKNPITLRDINLMEKIICDIDFMKKTIRDINLMEKKICDKRKIKLDIAVKKLEINTMYVLDQLKMLEKGKRKKK